MDLCWILLHLRLVLIIYLFLYCSRYNHLSKDTERETSDDALALLWEKAVSRWEMISRCCGSSIMRYRGRRSKRSKNVARANSFVYKCSEWLVENFLQWNIYYPYRWIYIYGDIFSNMNSIAAIQTVSVFVLFKKTVFNQWRTLYSENTLFFFFAIYWNLSPLLQQRTMMVIITSTT